MNKNTKQKVFQILGYVLFAVAAFMLIGMFHNSAKISRISKYHEKDVFEPNFKNYSGTNKDYLDGYVTAAGGFYDRDPIYSYVQNDPAASDLEFSLNIYRVRLIRTTYRLYFFPVDFESEGYLIEITDLKYKGEDIMQLDREYRDTEKYLFRVYLRFNTKLADGINQDESNSYYTISPMYPAIFDTMGLLQENADGETPELIGLEIAHVPLDADKRPIESDVSSLFIANSDGNVRYTKTLPIFDHNLTVSADDYTFTKDEVKGFMPTADEVAANNLSYQELDLSKYNGGVALSTIIIAVIVLLAAYFMFFNKLVVAKVQEKKREKQVAAATAKALEPKSSMEAEFTPTADDTEPEVVDADFEDAEEETEVETTEE